MDEKLLALQTELKGYFEKATLEKKEFGAAFDSTKAAIAALQTQVDAIDKKMAERQIATATDTPIIETLKENKELERLMGSKSGRANISLNAKQSQKLFEEKAVLASAAGFQTTGVIPIERMPGLVVEARQRLTIRNLLRATPTSMGVIDFAKVNSPLYAASPQVEGSSKYANAVTFTSASERVKTIATYIKASRQILDDWDELADYLNTGLSYWTNLAEETELLTGSNVGEHLNGLVTQATAFSTALLPAAGSYKRSDIVARVIQQIQTAKEVDPTFVVVNPVDYWNVRLEKDLQGRYIFGDPGNGADLPKIFGLNFVPTTSIGSGTFLVGSGDPAAAIIRDRMTTTIDISTENEDDFLKNLITIRVEKRLALVVRRPASFITGTFAQSPA